MKKLLLAGVIGLFPVATSHAADMSYPVKAPVVAVAPAFSWTGFYLGANAGGGWGKFKNTEYDYYSGEINAGRSIALPGYYLDDIDHWDHTAGGFFGGGQIGYNYQFSNNWVAGIEADFQWSGIKAEESGGDGYYSYKYGSKVDWFGTIRGRLGYAWDTFLLYGTGGVAYGKVEIYDSYSGDGYGSASHDDTNWGWTAGFGAEYAFAPNWTLKAEYLYVDLGSISKHDFYNDLPYYYYSDRDADFAFHTLKVGVNYKF